MEATDEEIVPTLGEQNAKRLQELADRGQTIDPLMILKARLDMVTDIVVDATQFPQNKLDAVWELYLAQLLDMVETADEEDDGSSE